MSLGWDRFWEARQVNPELVARELASDRWNLVEQAALDRYGSLVGREVIEVGSGMGINGLCMAIRGAKVSVLDVDATALQRASELFALFHVTPHLIQQDLFSSPDSTLENRFDVVMSFGLAEHFIGSERELCIQRHFGLARPGGIVIISVPNWSSFVVRFDTALLSLARRWRWGWQRFSRRKTLDWEIEVPFTRDELQSFGKKMCSDSEVYATNFGEGIDGFLRYIRYPMAAIGLNGLASRVRWSWVPMPVLDSRWGVSLVLVARKGTGLA